MFETIMPYRPMLGSFAIAMSGSIELVEGKHYNVDRDAGVVALRNFDHHAATYERRFVPHIRAGSVTPALVEQTRAKLWAAEARRARRNAKRAAAAAKVGE
jgi:hypothetical protein